MIQTCSILIATVCMAAPLATQERERLPDARVQQPYAFGVLTRGLVEPLRFAWTGEVPGISIDGPWIKGTPEQEGSYVIGLEVLDALDRKLETTYEVRVRPALEPLELLTTALPTFVVHEPVDYALAARGGEGPHRWQIREGAVPGGLSIQAAEGRIVGTPQQVGDIVLEVVLSDSVTVLPESRIVGRVAPPPGPPLDCALVPLPVAYYGVPYEAHLDAMGGQRPYRWELREGQPDWLELDPESGVVRGIPDLVGNHSLLARVRDALRATASCEGALEVALPPGYAGPTIAPNEPLVVLIGREIEISYRAVGAVGQPAWSFEWDAVPSWAEVAPREDSLVLSGVPDERGVHHLNLSVRDMAGARAGSPELGASEVTITIEVGELLPDPTPPQLLTELLPPAIADRPYEVPLRVSGGPHVVRCSGAPVGITVSEDGLIAGRPREVGAHVVELEVESPDGSTHSESLELQVVELASVIVEEPEMNHWKVVASIVSPLAVLAFVLLWLERRRAKASAGELLRLKKAIAARRKRSKRKS